MLTEQTGKNDLKRLTDVLLSIKSKPEVFDAPPVLHKPKRIMSVKEALFSKREILDISKCKGRVFASLSIFCPPAVPIIICGEEIDESAINCFSYYGVKKCEVVK